MWYANDVNGERVIPEPMRIGFCPICHEQLIPHCGAIVMWHWAHRSLRDCDAWSENETLWHRNWKALVQPECREVTSGDPGRQHRADIRTLDGLTIELQHVTLGAAEIAEREAFYGRMMWVFDVRACANNFDFRPRADIVTFRWKWPRKHITFATKPVFLDFGEHMSLFNLRMMSETVPCGGWGRWVTRPAFHAQYLGRSLVAS